MTRTHTENIKEARRLVREHRGAVTVGALIPNDVICVVITKKEAQSFIDVAEDSKMGILAFGGDGELHLMIEEARDNDGLYDPVMYEA